MGYSNVELANQALDHIGKEGISSLAETSAAAVKLNAAFDRTIHAALSASHWSFARKLLTLSNLTNDWEERWAFKYDKPSDCLTFIRIVPRVDLQNTEPQIPHQMLGSAIYCNEVNAKGEYVFETTDTTAMPQTFLDAVSLRLAWAVAMPLTRKQSVRDQMWKEYQSALSHAISQDAGQEPTFWGQDAGGYIEARGGASSEIEGAAPDGSIYWT